MVNCRYTVKNSSHTVLTSMVNSSEDWKHEQHRGLSKVGAPPNSGKSTSASTHTSYVDVSII